MSDIAVSPSTVAEATPKKAAKAKIPKKVTSVKSKGAKPTHPPTGEMVVAAIAALKERSGSSLIAIKKYIAATYKIDVAKQSTFIKKYLKSAVEKKSLIQTKGSGATGSFKLAVKGEVTKKKSTGKLKTVVAKKPAGVKKPVGEKKPAAKKPKAKKPAIAKASKPKSPSKAKKTGKAPAAKTKAPKPKKVSAPRKAAAKK